jgi:hypothetical protein
MMTDTIETRIKAFKASSFFTAGDPYSFSVVLDDEFSLPGKYNPKDYLSRLSLGIEGKNVLVVCPANAGLCMEAIHAGAGTVVAFEPRHLYHRPMATIAEFADELVGTTFIHRKGDADLVEKFDVVIWSEGVDDIPHPKGVFTKVFDAIAPGGRLYLELATGTHGALPDTTNCWKPTPEGLAETVESFGEFEVVSKAMGRNQTRKIFTIINNGQVRVEVLAGADYSTTDEVSEFAKKIEETLPADDTELDIKVERTKKAPAEDLDSVYSYDAEQSKTASTPKSQAKKDKAAAEAARKSKKRPKKGKSQP